MENGRTRTRSLLLFGALCIIWGIPYFFIRVAVQELSPAMVVFCRLTIASAILMPIALRRGALRGLGSRWPALATMALAGVALPFLLITAGEQRITSSLTGLLIASAPLMVALLAIRMAPDERVGGTRMAGLVIGVVGVACLLGIDLGGLPRQLVGAGMVLLAALGYALAALIVKRHFAGVAPLGTVTVTVAISAVVVAPLAAVSVPARLPERAVIGAIVALGVICTAAGYVCYFALIQRIGAGRAAVVTYVNPAIAAGLGVALLGEPISAAMVAGFLLIIAGSWLSTGGRPPPRVPIFLRGARRSAPLAGPERSRVQVGALPGIPP